MPTVEIDVKYVAHLARLSLSSDEEQKIGAQLGDILGYIEKLKAVDVTGVEPMTHALAAGETPFREDAVTPGLPPEEALGNAPARAGTCFQVPRIIE